MGNGCDGRTLPGGYQIVGELDRGAFAIVYDAQTASGDEVAIKVLTGANLQAQRRFRREIKVLRELPESPYLVKFYDTGYTPGNKQYLVMEKIHGYTLARLLDGGRKLGEKQACALMAQLCEALTGLHNLGMTHCDLKPRNIMMDRRNKRARLIDFGLVRDSQGLIRLLEQEHMIAGRQEFAEDIDAGMLVGTPEFVAPEQISDARLEDAALTRTDTTADVFSLGVIFYLMLTGDVPWPFVPKSEKPKPYRKELLRYMAKRIKSEGLKLTRPDHVSEPLWSIVQKALRNEPKMRQGDAQALHLDVQRYLDMGAGIPADLDEEHTILVDNSRQLDPRLVAAIRRAPPASEPPPAPRMEKDSGPRVRANAVVPGAVTPQPQDTIQRVAPSKPNGERAPTAQPLVSVGRDVEVAALERRAGIVWHAVSAGLCALMLLL